MSISMKSSKIQMYSEIEQLRTMLDYRNQTIRAQQIELDDLRTKNRQLRTSCEELSARVRARTTINHSHQVVSPTKARFMIQKRLAITLRAQVKWSEEHGFQYYEDGEWVQVPQHQINYVTHDLQD